MLADLRNPLLIKFCTDASIGTANEDKAVRKILQKLSMAILGIATVVSVGSTAPVTAASVARNVAGSSNSQAIALLSEYGDKVSEGAFERTFSNKDAKTRKPADSYGFDTSSVSDFQVNLSQRNDDLHSSMASVLNSAYLNSRLGETDQPSSQRWIHFYDNEKLGLYWSLLGNDEVMHLQYRVSSAIASQYKSK